MSVTRAVSWFWVVLGLAMNIMKHGLPNDFHSTRKHRPRSLYKRTCMNHSKLGLLCPSLVVKLPDVGESKIRLYYCTHRQTQKVNFLRTSAIHTNYLIHLIIDHLMRNWTIKVSSLSVHRVLR